MPSPAPCVAWRKLSGKAVTKPRRTCVLILSALGTSYTRLRSYEFLGKREESVSAICGAMPKGVPATLRLRRIQGVKSPSTSTSQSEATSQLRRPMDNPAKRKAGRTTAMAE